LFSWKKLVYLFIYQLFNEKVKLVGHGQELNKKVQELYRGVRGAIPTHALRIQQSSEEQLFLKFSDGTNLGQLCEKIERGFENLTNDHSIEFDAVMNVKNVIEAIQRVQKSADAVIRVNINIYGPESKCGEVGRDLSDKSLFLQEPNERREGTTYYNPHILLLEGIDDPETEEVVEAPNSNSEVYIPSSDRNEDFQETIAEVFSSLKRSDELRRLEGSENLNRALYQ
jgi:SWI/SNF-related matrix-associated actin-dependent regulator of chromatin subfamily A3